MTLFAFLGALELGLIYGLVAIAVFLTFRILDFPDLTVDGSLPLGSAVTAALIVADPFGSVTAWISLPVSFLAGACAGLVTAFLAVRFGILHLLASILTMIAAYSINIRIMGRPNLPVLGEETVLTSTVPLRSALGIDLDIWRVLVSLILIGLVVLFVIRLLSTDFGLAMRATGQNARFTQANGASPAFYIYFGLAVSNGLVALAGGVFTQLNGFADVNSGIGTIVVGLAAVILGETLFSTRKIWLLLLACVIGSILYRLAMAFALSADVIGLQPSDLNLVTAGIVALALIIPKLKASRRVRKSQKNKKTARPAAEARQ